MANLFKKFFITSIIVTSLAVYSTHLLFDTITRIEAKEAQAQTTKRNINEEALLVLNKTLSQNGGDSLVKLAALTTNNTDSLSNLIVLNGLFGHYSAKDLAKLIAVSRISQ